MARVRVRNWAEERKARKLRKLLAEVDPPKRIIREESYLRMDPVPLPRTVSPFKEGQNYVPEKPVVTRPGADTNQRYKSRGM
jgi:hypothetical protein